MIQELAKALNCNDRSIYEPTLYAAEDVMYIIFELDEHYNMPLYEVTDNNVSDGACDKSEKHICVGFNYYCWMIFYPNGKTRKKN